MTIVKDKTMTSLTAEKKATVNRFQSQQCYLQVESGISTGATFNLQPEESLTCGSEISNDVIIGAHEQKDWQISVLQRKNVVQLKVLSGTVTLDDDVIQPGQKIDVQENTLVTSGNSSFSLNFPQDSTDTFTAEATQKAAIDLPYIYHLTERRDISRHMLYAFSIAFVVAGVMSAMYAVTGSLILVNADTNRTTNNFMDVVKESELGHLEVRQIEGSNRYTVDGTLNSREENILLNRMAKESNAELVLNLRINDLLSESVEDIFRVNGLQATTEVQPNGEVKIFTQTTELSKLEQLREKIRKDLPTVARFEIINTEPAITKPEKKGSFVPSPDKRITLISAGEKAYIMTEDQSRYFIGALLPSGHLIEAIKEGTVIVSKNGKTDRLSY